LEAGLRDVDTLARFGGDEFAVLVESISTIRDAEQVAERILTSLERPFYVNERVLHVTASIGIVITWSDYAPGAAEDILRDAEIAMYRAKEQGGSIYQIFERPMRDQLILRKQIEDELRNAIRAEQFVLHYQPIFSLLAGAVVGFEALIRWEHPERGLISPAEFIPIAEATGMIVSLGRWIFRQACQQAKAWEREAVAPQGFRMSVNFSPIQFKQADFVPSFTEALREDGIDASRINVEITENVLSDDQEHIIGCLTQLMALGMHVHLDDFGTGYSSLSQIGRLPIHAIKIDRSFVNALEVNADRVELTRSIITMGHNMGLEIIAEGIETKGQLETLRRLGADYGQGYYLSRPHPAEVISAHMKPRMVSV
jgi:Amt family ammonium transporter